MRREGDISDFFSIASCYFPNLFLSAEGKTECEKKTRKRPNGYGWKERGKAGTKISWHLPSIIVEDTLAFLSSEFCFLVCCSPIAQPWGQRPCSDSYRQKLCLPQRWMPSCHQLSVALLSPLFSSVCKAVSSPCFLEMEGPLCDLLQCHPYPILSHQPLCA